MYQDTLNSRGFVMTDSCNCGGTLKESWRSRYHKGIEFFTYPKMNAVRMNYYSITKYEGPLSTLEDVINQIIVQAKAAA